MKTVRLSEWKKLNFLEKKMLKFMKNKEWLFGILPFLNFGAGYYSFSHHTVWYWVLFFVIFFLVALIILERYGNLTVTSTKQVDKNITLKKWARNFIEK